jgi:hypothetical protein
VIPTAIRFWDTKAVGTGAQTLSWPLRSGHWSAVVMNADGSRSVAVNARLGAHVSYLWWIVAGLFVLGGLSLLGGGALAYSGIRTKTQATTEEARMANNISSSRQEACGKVLTPTPHA